MARPVELAKSSRFLVLASVCIVIGALYFGREVLIPISLAVLLSFVLSPAVRWLERLRLPRTPAVLAVVLTGLFAIVVLAYVVGHQFLSVIEEMPKYQGELAGKVERLRRHGGVIGKAETETKNLLKTVATSQPATTRAVIPPPVAGVAPPDNGSGKRWWPWSPAATPPPSNASAPTAENPLPVREYPATSAVTMLREWAGTVLDPLATAGLVLILLIFMLFKREDLRDRMIRLVGHGRLNLTTQALDEAGTRISKYLGALSIVNAAYGTFVAGGLWVIGHYLGGGQGFPNVLVWGLLVGLFRFVPYIGIWIGASMPLLLSFALFPGNGPFFGTLGMFLALEIVVAQFIEPMWYGASTGMSALAVLVAAVFWTWLWGGIGLLLSTPLTVCLVVIGKYVPQLQFLDIMLGDEPVLPPHTRVYQRLIALDEEEASDVVEEFMADHTLEEAYDRVLIPALAMAEQDRHRGKLDDDRHRFIRQAMKELVDELGEAERTGRDRAAAEATVLAAKDEKPVPAQRDRRIRAPLPKDCRINVLCLPAKDESDEIVCQMLAQLLEFRGYCAASASVTALASEMVELIEQRKADIVVVSALPPSAVTHARYLCKRIHVRFPEINMAVGLWTARAELRKAKSRITCVETVRMVTTLTEAQDQLDQMAHVVNAAAPAADEELAGAPR